jgi:predicted nucleic acid-binding protein
MISVVDASVALKWQFEDEEATRAATALLEDFIEGRMELISPTLFPYEILSAINVAINKRRIDESTGYKAITYITSIGIELKNIDDLIVPIFSKARKYRLSPYDCAYIALAEKEKCNFYTGDRKLFNLIQRLFPWVKWIGNYSTLNAES